MRGAPRLWISAVLLGGGVLAASGLAASAQTGSTYTVTVPPQGKQGKTKQSKNLSVPKNVQPPAWNGGPAYNAAAPYNPAPAYNAAPSASSPYGAAPAHGTAPAAAPQGAPPASAAAGPNSARFLATYGAGGSGANSPAASAPPPPATASATNAGRAAASTASTKASSAAAAGSAYGSQAATSGYAAVPTAGAGYTATPAQTTNNAYASTPAASTSGTYGTSPSGGSTFTATTSPKGSSKSSKHSRDIPVPASTVVAAGNAPAYNASVHGSMVAPTSAGAPAAVVPTAYDTTTSTPPSFDARTLLKPTPQPKVTPHVLVHSTTVLPDGMEPNPPDEDEIVRDKLSWKGEYELDRNEQVLLDAEGKPVPVLYTAKGRAVRPRNVRLSGRHPATILNGVLTVDGFPAKGRLNYAVQDMKFLYFSAPGIGTVVVSPAPFDGGEEQKDAFNGETLTVKAGDHDFALATERPILGKDNAPAFVKLDKDYVADKRNPVMGYGMHDEAPYMWPGAIHGKAMQGSVDAPPIPVNMRPKMNAAPCPADRICPE